jgi:hypothetical protein
MLVLALQFSRDGPIAPRQVRVSTPKGRQRLSTGTLTGTEEAGAPSQRNSERRATRALVVPFSALPRAIGRNQLVREREWGQR